VQQFREPFLISRFESVKDRMHELVINNHRRSERSREKKIQSTTYKFAKVVDIPEKGGDCEVVSALRTLFGREIGF
jgi:hypothetical protein